jgi:peptide/nickel transport system permease protein
MRSSIRVFATEESSMSVEVDIVTVETVEGEAPGNGANRYGFWRLALRSPATVLGGSMLLAVLLVALAAPLAFTTDPIALNMAARLRPVSADAWFGTDMFGRDMYSRVIYGCRTSLLVGISVTALAVNIGLLVGLVAGYLRALDAVVMRVMDGLMAIPGILLAIAMVALSGASFTTVIFAITVPEIPRVVRLVRSVVLTVREEPYVESAIAAGTRLPGILWRHVLPNTIAPLIVMASYLCSSAILVESLLSFLGAGLPTEIPSWGNMIAEGRTYFLIYPRMVFLPGLFLALTVLGINILGDGMRDVLDPRISRTMQPLG